MAALILNQIITMFIILVIGVIGFKTKLITKDGSKVLSNLLLMVVNPINIALSFQREYQPELLINLLTVLILALFSYVVIIILGTLLIPKKEKEYAIERFSIVFANCGYFGIPLINSIYGQEGVFYLAAYLMAFNLCVWSYGISLFKGENKISLKELGKNMCNLNISAVFLGFLLFVFGVSLPAQLYNGLNYVAQMNTALSMLVAGATLAQSDLKNIFCVKRTYLITFLRLIAVPVFIFLLLKPFPISDMVRTILVISSACPAATTGLMFALRFDKNAEYVSSIYIMSTLFSLVTIPIIALLL